MAKRVNKASIYKSPEEERREEITHDGFLITDFVKGATILIQQVSKNSLKTDKLLRRTYISRNIFFKFTIYLAPQQSAK
jgi:hypothetical protein